ncbi:siderophore-interacting protein [Williamsia deligens]|uniref:Siderophore-interacting protein n=1 Tax=Williamsia deligens TaxID=321325 RepID=A0ABW3GH26_9NOCA|nr:siderophore-interacting protein [Williamsia deligens]MCP2195532.1 NADPH-dependent ferric siderophore reductase, contains FAD-binding and SIP domains [Williamsia deligens]
MGKRLNTMEVRRTEWITPHMVRVHLGGPGFADFAATGDTDAYIKIIFGAPGVTYPEPFDLDRIRAEFAPHEQPVLRTYTVRSVDEASGEIAVDFVVHGDAGVAGPWAASAVPGETVRFLGPGSGYRPDPDAPWHLLAADEAGLPALAAALAALPPTATAQAFIEVAGPEDEIALETAADASITWVHRGVGSDVADDSVAGDRAPIIEAVRTAPWLDGEPQVFIHGEAQAVMHHLRPYIRKERGVSARRASISGYWRRGRTEEGFRQWKAELRRAEEPVPTA